MVEFEGALIPVVLLAWLGCGMAAVLLLVMAAVETRRARRLNMLPGRAPGEVTGLVCSHLLRNETEGEVPGGALIGWGVAQGEQYWGGWLKKRVPPWFPCVTFQAEGQTITRIFGEGAFRKTWTVGQHVTVLYDPENPRRSILENDPSLRFAVIVDLIAAAVFLAAALVVTLVFL